MSPYMFLNEYSVPNSQLVVSVSTVFSKKEMSGETSATDIVHKGIKPKELNVSFVLPFDKADSLMAFYNVAQAIDDNGDLVNYDVTEKSANAALVNQVKFTNRIEQREIPGLHAWRVSFTLVEQLSAQEKIEQRTTLAQAEPTATEGESVSPPSSVEEPQLSVWESSLASFDERLS